MILNIKSNRPFLLLFLCILTLGGCSKNQALFTMDSYLEATLLAGTSSQLVWGLDTEVFLPYTIQLDAVGRVDSEIMSINSSYGLIYPKNTNLDLSFINEIVVNVLDPDSPQDNREVFYYNQQNFNRISQIELFPSLPDIKNYVRDDKILVQVEFIFNTPPPRTFDLAFELEFGAIEIDEP